MKPVEIKEIGIWQPVYAKVSDGTDWFEESSQVYGFFNDSQPLGVTSEERRSFNNRFVKASQNPLNKTEQKRQLDEWSSFMEDWFSRKVASGTVVCEDGDEGESLYWSHRKMREGVNEFVKDNFVGSDKSGWWGDTYWTGCVAQLDESYGEKRNTMMVLYYSEEEDRVKIGYYGYKPYDPVFDGIPEQPSKIQKALSWLCNRICPLNYLKDKRLPAVSK